MQSHRNPQSVSPSILQRWIPGPLTLGAVPTSEEESRAGHWSDLCGIIGAEAMIWAERLVHFGNHRLVPVVIVGQVVSRQRCAMPSRHRLAADLDEGPEYRALHVVRDPGFGGRTVRPVVLRPDRKAQRYAEAMASLRALAARLGVSGVNAES